MIVYYAPGGGLGHLTRGLRVLAKLQLDATIVTTSQQVEDRQSCLSTRDRQDGLSSTRLIRVPRHLEHDRLAHRDWLRDLGATRLIADAFPGGIQGELCGLDMPIDYVARLLRWDAYRAAVPFELPHIETTYVVEELTHAPCGNVVLLDLSLPLVDEVEEEPYSLVVHSGPEEEVRELVAYARELDATNEVVVAGTYPAAHLFPAAAKIITAAGFNVMLETEQWRAKHVVVPFARRFDDQYVRAARRRKRLSSAYAPAPAAAM
ncbi:MAG TPA: hypothetical protein VF266_01510 [Thermoanaerobaculia bacterium]